MVGEAAGSRRETKSCKVRAKQERVECRGYASTNTYDAAKSKPRWASTRRRRAPAHLLAGYTNTWIFKEYRYMQQTGLPRDRTGRHKPKPQERILSPNVNLLEAVLPSNFRALTRPLTRSSVNTTKRRNAFLARDARLSSLVDDIEKVWGREQTEKHIL